ncbi:MAG: SLBB domain-containing protein [Thermodesulfobacteriota bacterium]|nr:SLBB domain-containing protein [Thermodesulfobacteriota bacterium]
MGKRSEFYLAVAVAVAAMVFGFPISGVCENYIIGSGDTFRIEVYDHPDLETTVQVDGEGRIRFPLIGEIQASEKSVSDLSELIEQKLADGYIINPQVSIIITEYRSRKATILGQVNKPALYELRGRTTLLELISKAEGLTKEAGTYAYVKRKPGNGENVNPERGVLPGDDNERVIQIDLNALVEGGDTTQNILIKDGDSVFIPEMKKVYVTGEVKRSGAYAWEEGLTVIRAITNAAGFTDKASSTNIKIIRTRESGQKVTLEKVKMDTLVAPEDVIVVPESFF